MANERKEPTLSSSTLNDPRKAQAKSASPRSDRRTAPATKSSARPQSSRPAKQVVVTKTSNGLVFFVMLLALAGIGGAGYALWQLQQANQTIVSQQARIADLENKLTVSDDTSSQSITSLAANIVAMNDDVKLSLTEIDKLWATRNVNKDAIADNAEKLAAIEDDIQSTKTSLTAADKSIEQLQTTTKQLDEGMKTQTNTVNAELASVIEKTEAQGTALATATQQIERLEADKTELERLSQNLKTQTSQQEITLQSLRERVSNATNSANSQLSAQASAQINQLATQVNDNQEAIAAIDAFRLTVNRELLLLKQRTQATP